MDKKCGIYKVTINNKAYIGQAVNLNVREKRHLHDLNNNNHHNLHLQNAYSKYRQYKFEVIEECSRELLNEREIHYIKEYDSIEKGYNLQKGGQSGGYVLVGHPRESEIRKQMSESMKGKVHSEEAKIKMSKAATGRVATEETKIKMSEQRKGKNTGKDNPMFGRKMTEEEKDLRRKKMNEWWANASEEVKEARNKKISTGNKGIIRTETWRQNQSEAHMGQLAWNKGKTGIYSEESLKQMSDSQKERYRQGATPWNKNDIDIEEAKEICLREGTVLAASKILGYSQNNLRRRFFDENIIPVYDLPPNAKAAKVIGFTDRTNPDHQIKGFTANKNKKYTIDEIKEACLREGTQRAAARALGFRSLTPVGARLKRAGIKVIYDRVSTNKNANIIGFEDLL